jgi:hypothetical protein
VKIEIEFKHWNEKPVYKGKYQADCLLLNKCDGWHEAFIAFDEDGFVGFQDFVGNGYIPGVFFVAWAELPDSNEIAERFNS